MSDPYFDNVSLLIPFEYSTAIPQDYSPNKKQLIPVGSVVPSPDSKYYGKAALFDGWTGYVDIPPSVDFDFGTGDYTVEFWFNTKQVRSGAGDSAGYIRLLCPSKTVNQPSTFQIWIVNDDAEAYGPKGVVGIALPGGTGTTIHTTQPITDAQWHHVAFTRQSGETRCYLDGILKSQVTDTTQYSLAATEGFRIGARVDLRRNQFFYGSLQDFRITKGVCRYTTNFTPPGSFLSSTNLTGTVLTTEGIPKSGMTVRCIDRNPKIQRMWTTKTDKFGHYSFLLPKGDYTILAQDDNGNLNDQVKRVRN